MSMPQRLLMNGISCKTGDVEQGTAPCFTLFYLKFNSSANQTVFDCLHNPGQFTERCLLFTITLW